MVRPKANAQRAKIWRKGQNGPIGEKVENQCDDADSVFEMVLIDWSDFTAASFIWLFLLNIGGLVHFDWAGIRGWKWFAWFLYI